MLGEKAVFELKADRELSRCGPVVVRTNEAEVLSPVHIGTGNYRQGIFELAVSLPISYVPRGTKTLTGIL